MMSLQQTNGSIVIIDYGIGNLGSVLNMLKKIGATARIASDPLEISRADKLILPGVGAFDTGMQNLHARGLVPLLNELVKDRGIPLLGLCLGMQLLTERSEEGQLNGLGWMPATTRRFLFSDENANLKVPHMGWNTIHPTGDHPLLNDLAVNARFYFVHSYHVVCHDPTLTLAVTDYGYPFASIIGRGNILGVQFHPEKSHRFGMLLLKNFVQA